MTDLHVGTRGDVASPTSHEMPSGVFVELTDPHPADIDVLDIAHNLSNECRYAGSCRVHWSVAEHVILVARHLREVGAHPATVLLGLHHDDPEAYLKDLPRPLKRALEALAPGAYSGLEARFAFAISAALGLHVDHGGGLKTVGSHSEVKQADQWALGVEAVTMLPSKGVGWIQLQPQDRPDGVREARTRVEEIYRGDPWEAREQFLAEHERCVEEARRVA